MNLQFNAAQPATLWQPVEDGDTRIAFEIQFVRISAAVAWPLSGTEFIDNIEVRAEPTSRAACGKPHEIGFKLQLRRTVGLEGQKDRFDCEVQPRDPCRQAEREDQFKVRLSSVAHRCAIICDDSRRVEECRERERRFNLELWRAEERIPYWGSRVELMEVIAMARENRIHAETTEFPLAQAVDVYREGWPNQRSCGADA